MKAIAIEQFGGRDFLKVMELPVPPPGEKEIRIKIKAAGVNYVDVKIRKGLLKERLPCEFPLIPGWDAAGVVDETGPGATRFKKDDAVYAYCRKPVIKDGCYAEYVVVSEEVAAMKPSNMSFDEAGAVPLAGLTAYQSLFEAAQLKGGETILIHAAAGGVGSFAVQLAHDAGAHVIGSSGAANHEYIKSLGAHAAIDYTIRDFRQTVQAMYPDGVDVVFDCVGGDTLTRSVDVLAKKGRLVSILDATVIKQLQENGVRAHYVFVSPNGSQLDHLRQKIEEGSLSTHLAAVLPLTEAARAHEMIETRHTVGKIVLSVGA
ncbi:MAG TPA: NADP-dependent oxidoreductase [Verrucomicrobia bacterium]|nr:MAG: hypothetical protein A2X46_16870 [Lentisphaerae bacterium GWF2_57_35]HBA82595.1 NADP-dependent oxidoreductase [Verrucomicrobiota bacterium]